VEVEKSIKKGVEIEAAEEIIKIKFYPSATEELENFKVLLVAESYNKNLQVVDGLYF
jgi:hypothetical protein